MKLEIRPMRGRYVLEQPFSFSCPECGGVLRSDMAGTVRQFRCHIGHTLTSQTMLAAQFASLEAKLGSVLATLNERAALCEVMGQDAVPIGDESEAFRAAAHEALARADTIRRLLEEEWVEPIQGEKN
jgi:two-component system, chemotaxis family, protein-glutamate methylesterase/glutaminase